MARVTRRIDMGAAVLAVGPVRSVLLTAAVLLLLLPSAAQSPPSVNAVTCNATFISMFSRTIGWWLEYSSRSMMYMSPLLSQAALCPANCTQPGVAFTPVFGSFPYAQSSSVCRAAIHAGIINATLGGGVLLNQFHQHDWSNTSTQSIFPFASGQGSLSNGVQSLDVPRTGGAVPASPTMWSFTVRGRGDRVVQRRQAPFPPRSNHLHLWGNVHYATNLYWQFHIIAGGFNGTHFLNDVWLGYTTHFVTQYYDFQWVKQPDAPWSPRADMMARGCGGNGAITSLNPPAVPNMCYVAGGQTASRCGLYELGECSDEAWRLFFNFSTSGVIVSRPPFNVSWSQEPVWRLPSPPRCGAQLAWRSAHEDGWGSDHFDRLLIHGGQLSYSDSSCAAQPVFVNDVWTAHYYYNLSGVNWTLQAPAPYSPRRLTAQAQSGDAVGGVRYTTAPTSSSSAKVVRVEVMADVWLCSRIFSYPDEDTPYHCRWSADQDENPSPSTFLAAPGGGQVRLRNPSQLYERAFDAEVSLGGYSSVDYLRQWQLVLPELDDAVPADLNQSRFNATLTVGPLGFYGASHSWSTMMAGRGWLPVNATLDEAELSDEDGMYRMGSGWLQTYTKPDGVGDADMQAYATLHWQPYAFADDPANATWWMPQAAPSSNTTRPLFNFPLRRRDHQYFPQSDTFTFNALPTFRFDSERGIVSGGRSGDVYTSDWVELHQPLCLHPLDPSYRELLGAVRWAVSVPSSDSARLGSWDGYSFRAGQQFHVYCEEGHHFEPPLLAAQATLVCMANTVWMDPSARTIRTCVPDRLKCSPPLRDLGAAYCEPAPPVISELVASYRFNGRHIVVPSRDPITLYELPLIDGVLLTIVGNVFFKPVTVLLGGEAACVDGAGELLASVAVQDEPLPVGCYNRTVNGSRELTCEEYGTAITCQLPRLDVQRLPVSVRSGLMGEVTSVEGEDGDAFASLSSMAPIIVNMTANSSDCVNQDVPLAVLNCPLMRSFHVHVCLASESVNGVDDDLQAWLSDGTHLACEAGQHHASQEGEVCLRCTVYPRYKPVQLEVRRLSRTVEVRSRQQPSISFDQCPQGMHFDVDAALSANKSMPLCALCDPGSSTDGAKGALACSLCRLGHFANGSGASLCSPCPVGTFANVTNSTECLRCPGNAYARDVAQSACEPCQLNSFIVYKDAAQVGIAGECLPCPTGAWCDLNGTITAAQGSYLLIDQPSGIVQAVSCSPSACVQATPWSAQAAAVTQWVAEAAPLPSPQFVTLSGLQVLNQCAQGRWPSYVADPSAYPGVEELEVTEGHNVLCACCLPGYSQVNGRCVPCASTNSGALMGVMLLALVLVFLVHRLPHDWTGSATLSIVSNFLQLSALFVASTSTPQLLSLFNVQLIGDRAGGGHADLGDDTGLGGCVVPLSDGERIALSLLSPLIALALLAGLMGVQLLWRWTLVRKAGHVQDDEAGQGGLLRPPARWSLRVYRWLWVPAAPPRVSESDMDGGGVQAAAIDDSRATPLLLSFDVPAVPADGRCLHQSYLLPPYQRSLVRLVLLSYTALTVVTLGCFHWQWVGEFGYRLVDYPTLRPDSTAYAVLLPVAALVLALVVCLLPVALAGLLWRHHRNGELEAVKAKQAGAVGMANEARALSWKEALLLQLTAMYRPSCWWMAPLVLLRRLLLVALMVGFGAASVWGWLTIAQVGLLLLHERVLPYQRRRDNALETLCLFSLTLQTALRSLYPPPYQSAALMGAFNALVVTPLVPALLHALQQMWTRWRGRKAALDASEP